MNARVLLLTLRALVPTRGYYYFWLLMLGFIYFSASVNYGPQIHILMYFILLYFFAYLSGSLLLDMQVKPVAFLLPGRQDTLPWIILGIAIIYGVFCAIPLLISGPANVLAGTGLSLPGIFLLGLVLFQVVVLVCFRLQTSFLLFALFICLFVFAPNPYLVYSFRRLVPSDNTLMLWSVVILAVTTFFTFRMPREEGFRRHLCGKTVMTFVDLGSPARVIRIFGKLKQDHWRREAASLEQPAVRQTLSARLGWVRNPERRSVLDEVEMFYHRTNWKYAMLNVLLFSVVIGISNTVVFRSTSPALVLLFPLFIIFEQFYAFFFRRFSPMLPISREQYFRINLYKGALVYMVTIGFFLLVLIGFRLLYMVLPAPASEMVRPFAFMPLRAGFYFALAAPVYSWIYIVIRGMGSYLILVLVFAISSMLITLFLFDDFLQLPLVVMLLITALMSAPYVLQSHIRCIKSDLIRL